MAEKKTQKEPKASKKDNKVVEAPKQVVKRVPAEKVPARLYEKYKKEIVPKLMEKFSYTNVMQVPKIHKIVVNCGVGDAVGDPKVLDEVVKDLTIITGQKPSIRKAKKDISNFKLRVGLKIGAMVTLRRSNMYEFLDRFIAIALPKVRDFKGVSDKSFDGRGNYTVGLKEHVIFPEINIDKINKVFGMDITFVTTASTDEEAAELLKSFGIPFRKKENN